MNKSCASGVKYDFLNSTLNYEIQLLYHQHWYANGAKYDFLN